MGVSVSIQTKFLYKIVNNGDLLPQIIYAEFKDMFFENMHMKKQKNLIE